MATANSKQSVYQWEGKDRKGKLVKGEMRANGEAVVNATLRRQAAERGWGFLAKPVRAPALRALVSQTLLRQGASP